jgi:hypothetical protein
MTIQSDIKSAVLASLAGSGVLLAAGRFDREYAPRTVAGGKDFAASTAVTAACLTLGGVVFAAFPRAGRSPLYGGVALGLFVYLLSALGVLPATRLAPALWRQNFPQICGGLLRHVIAGVTTSAVYVATLPAKKSIQGGDVNRHRIDPGHAATRPHF